MKTVTNITSRTTRQELVDILEAEREATAKLRQDVVDLALKRARRHGWCSVVQNTLREAGLGDLLPPEFVVQRQYRAGSKWLDHYTENTLKKAQAAVKGDVRDKTPRPASANESVYLGSNYITPRNVDRILQDVRNAKRSFRQPVRTPATPEYPKYRVVERTTADKVVFTESDL